MLVDPQYSDQQQREVTTYVVSPRGGGALHCSIQQAVDKADAYSRIVVQEGTYYESVTVTRPVELVGEEGVLPEISFRGIGLTVSADVECYIENLKIITKGTPTVNTALTQIRGTNASVKVTGGLPTFVQCVMTSLYVGGNASPTICNCSISGSVFGPGITVAEYAGGMYRNNVVSNHVPFCVVVSTKGEPKFEDNEFSQNARAVAHAIHNAGAVTAVGHSGVVLVTRQGKDITRNVQPEFVGNAFRDDVGDTATTSATTFAKRHGHIDYNRDFSMDRCCVRVDQTCTPNFRENNIMGSTLGVHVRTGAGGTFVDNSIYGAVEYGVVLSVESFPTFRINTISKCATGLLAEGTSALLTHNTVRDNHGAGLLLVVGPRDNFRLEGNSFVANDTGIVVRPGSRKKASDDAMRAWIERQHRLHGRETGADSTTVVGGPLSRGPPDAGDADHPEMTRSPDEGGAGSPVEDVDADGGADADGPAVGAAVRPAHGGMLRGTKQSDMAKYSVIIGQTAVSHNRMCGIAFLSPTFPVLLTDADIVHNGNVGVLVSQGSSPTIRGVRFEKGKVGVRIERSGRPIIRNCTFMSQTDASVHITEHGMGRIVKNILAGFTGAGVKIDDGSNPLVKDNEIRQSAGIGVQVLAGGIGVIDKNRITATGIGVEVTSYGDPIVEGNSVQNCSEMGLYVRDEGLGTFVNNTVERCHIGFGVAGHSEPTFRQNRVVLCVCVGAILSSGSRAQVEKNVFEGSTLGNVLLEGEDSCSMVCRNVVRDSEGFGIRSQKNGGGTVARNVVTNNRESGLSSSDGGCALFVDNTLTNQGAAGIRVLDKGAGIFRRNTVSICAGAGIELETGANAVIDHCTVAKAGRGGIVVHPRSAGAVRDTVVRLCDVAGILVAGKACWSSTTFANLTVEENNGPGFKPQHQEAAVTLTRCTFRKHALALELHAMGKTEFHHCKISENGKGALVTSRGVAKLRECEFEKNTELDVDITSEGDVQISQCSFEGSPVAILARHTGRGECVQSTFNGQQTASIVLTSGATSVIMKNRFTCVSTAIISALGAAADVALNVIRRPFSAAGILSLVGDASKFTSNEILDSCGNGLVVEAGSAATFTRNTVNRPLRNAFVVLMHRGDFDTALSVLKRDEQGRKRKTVVPTDFEESLFMPDRPFVAPTAEPEPTALRTPRSTPPPNVGDAGSDDDEATGPKPPPGPTAEELEIAALPPAEATDRAALFDLIVKLSVIPRDKLITFRQTAAGTAAKAVTNMKALALGAVNRRVEGGTAAGTTNQETEPAADASTADAQGGSGEGSSSIPELKRAKDDVPHACHINVLSNTFTDAGECGIYVAPLCSATSVAFVANVVKQSRKHGVAVDAAAQPLFYGHNNVTLNNDGGVVALGYSQMDFRDSMISHNSPCNVRLDNHASGRVSGCSIEAGAPHGAMVFNARSKLFGNRIHEHGSGGAGLTICAPAPDFVAEENTFDANMHAVVFDAPEATAKLLRNKILGASTVGCKFAAGTRPIVHENVFTDCVVGVALDFDSAGELVGNRFSKNRTGVAVTGDGIAVKFVKNHFEANAVGVHLRGNDTLLLEANEFFENTEAGIHADEVSQSKLHKNVFSADRVGVLCTTGAAPRIFRNRFVECGTGALLRPGAGALIEKAYFDHCEIGVMCRSGESAKIVALNCIFGGCTVAGWCSESIGEPSRVSRSLFMRCRDQPMSCGVLLRDGGGGTFTECDFHYNAIGVLATSSARGEVTKCHLHDNQLCGIQVVEKATTAFQSCTLFRHKVADVIVFDGGCPLVKRCTLSSPSRGLVLGVESAGSFSHNIIKDSIYGVVVSGCATPAVDGNFITGCGTAVVLTPAGGQVSLVGNHIMSCGHGISAQPRCGGNASGNFFAGCELAVVLEPHSGLSLVNNGLTRCGKAAILVRGAGSSLVSSNRVTDNAGASGVSVYAAGMGPALPGARQGGGDAGDGGDISTPGSLGDLATPEVSFADAGVLTSPPAALQPADGQQAAVCPPATLFGAPLPRSVMDLPAAALGDLHRGPPAPRPDEPQHTVSENDISKCDACVLAVSGRTLVRRNHIHDGEFGVFLQPEAAISLQDNIVYDHSRAGLKMLSRGCEMHGNEFSSKDSTGAVDLPSEKFQVPQGNTIMNQTAVHPQALPISAPSRLTDLSPSVPGKGRDVTGGVQSTLLNVHRTELPDYIPCGCPSIQGSSERSASVATMFEYRLDFAAEDAAATNKSVAFDGAVTTPDSDAASPAATAGAMDAQASMQAEASTASLSRSRSGAAKKKGTAAAAGGTSPRAPKPPAASPAKSAARPKRK